MYVLCAVPGPAKPVKPSPQPVNIRSRRLLGLADSPGQKNCLDPTLSCGKIETTREKVYEARFKPEIGITQSCGCTRRSLLQIRPLHRLRSLPSMRFHLCARMRTWGLRRFRRDWRIWLRRSQCSDDHQPKSRLGDRRRQRLYANGGRNEFRCLGNQCRVERDFVNDDLFNRLRGYSAGNGSDDRDNRYGHGHRDHCGRHFFWRSIHHQCSFRPDRDGRARPAANSVPADELFL